MNAKRFTESDSIQARRGFTLLELLIVIGIIAFMFSVFTVVVANFTESAEEAATKATLVKLDRMLRQQQSALDHFLDTSKELNEVVEKLHQRIQSEYQITPSKEVLRLLMKKRATMWYMPQNIAEVNSGKTPTILTLPLAGNTTLSPRTKLNDYFQNNTISEADSSECLYFFLTEISVGGTEIVDVSQFNESELRDTDGDGLLEFHDAWGQPIRFYRWPTRMFRPTGLGQDGRPGVANVNDNDNQDLFTDDDTEVGWSGSDDGRLADGRNLAAGLLMPNLPPPPAPGSVGIPDLLGQDPDDPFGILVNDTAINNAKIQANQNANWRYIEMWNFINEDALHTPATYHAPMIVSAGPDQRLGMIEPNNTITDTESEADFRAAVGGNADQIMTWMTSKGRLGQPFIHRTSGGSVVAEIDGLTDNLVSRGVLP